MKMRYLLLVAFVLPFFVEITPAGDEKTQIADLVVHNAKVLTVDGKFSIAEAIAVKDERILAVGKKDAIFKYAGASTQLIDAKGRNVLPGLYDSHTHPLGAAMSELDEELPYLKSLDDVFTYIRAKAQRLPEGEWIVLRFAFPTR